MRRRLVLLLALCVGCGEDSDVVPQPQGYVAAPPAGLPEFMVERRSAVIAEHVERVLAEGETEIRARYGRVFQYADAIERAAAEHGVEPMRVAAIIAQESRGDPTAESAAGAVGLMQLMPLTAVEFGAPCGLTDATQRTDPGLNVCTGTRYYAGLVQQYAGDSETALARYNFGRLDDRLAALPADSVRSVWTLHGLDRLPKETAEYVPYVLAWEAVFRFLARTNAVPVVAVEVMDAPAYRASADDDGKRRRTARKPRRLRRLVSAMPSILTTDYRPPTTDVWYAAREGDTYIGVVFAALSDPRPADIDALNPELAVGGLFSGALLMLPTDRYIFYGATGRASYATIAHAHGMAAATLLRWNGRWTDADVAHARLFQCAHNGCDDGDEVPIEGTKILVRIPERDH